jgi:Protein of unknown function (DUF3071)
MRGFPGSGHPLPAGPEYSALICGTCRVGAGHKASHPSDSPEGKAELDPRAASSVPAVPGGAEGTPMQELRLVAVSEDGSYAVLVAPGSGGRFMLPIDDRLRIVARGQFSRLAQYEIEVESPLRPKEIQDRIRAGETAEEIADAAGVPIERVRRFEGPVLAERAYRAQEAQRATLRQPGDTGPGRPLLEVVGERLRGFGADPDEIQWDSRKRPDGDWQVRLSFSSGSRSHLAEWAFDPRRKHVTPADDTAARLCLPAADLPEPPGRPATTATVTPIGSRLSSQAEHDSRRQPEAGQASAARPASQQPHSPQPPAPQPLPPQPLVSQPHPPQPEPDARPAAPAASATPAAGAGRERPARKAAGGRSRRSSVPSWDEIMLGTSRHSD